MSVLRKVVVAGGFSTIAFNSYVWKNRQSIHGVNEFKPGSADEMLTETLRPGDVLLFQRAWYRYSLPKAISVALYQYLHNSSLDHCGMVVLDPQGELFVFELSPRGHICTPYRERIHQSHADSIVLIPLESAAYEDDSVGYRKSIFQEVQRVTAATAQPYEPLEIVKGCVAKLLVSESDGGQERGAVTESRCSQHPHCPSVQIVLDAIHNSTGVSFEHTLEQPLCSITPDDFFKRRLRIVRKGEKESDNDVAATKEAKFGTVTIIRDM